METIPARPTKSRRTYLLAGIPCLCWEGSLYAPEAGQSVNLGKVLVTQAFTPGAVIVDGASGPELWSITDRQSLKARGAALKKPIQRPAPVEEPA
jgi:hypothetical protein